MKNYGEKFFSADFKSYNGKIPYVITDVILKLDESHSEVFEGIFRKNGPRHQINSLCQQLDNNKIKIWKAEYLNIEVLSCTLKRFLAQHSKNDDTIIDKQMERILQEIYLHYKNDENERIIQYKFFFDKLCSDDTRKFSLAFLLRYLHKISVNSEQNLMHAGNLSSVLFLNLFPMPEPSQEEEENFGNDVKNSINKEILKDLIEKGNLLLEDLESDDYKQKLFMNDEDIANFVFSANSNHKSRNCLIF